VARRGGRDEIGKNPRCTAWAERAAQAQHYTGAMNMLRTVVLGLTCALPMLALAQWQWVETDGRKVFSDQPPPAHIPAGSILKQPGARAKPLVAAVTDTATPTAAPAAAAPRPTASAPRISGKDKELEAKKKQAEAAEADKLKAEKDKVAKLRADNCARARSAKADYDSGARLARTNAKGEREILDDAARAAEVSRLQGILTSECKDS
jgi:hypothetical protein